MRQIKYIIYLFAVTALLMACSESLKDTYSDYAGDGKIRYVAKCTEFHAVPRWESIRAEWKNGTDATIQKIKIIWSFEEQKDSVLLPGNAESYELANLVDGTYRFDLCALDSAGNESLRETTYGRPYTRNHEVMRAFTRGIIKSFFLNNNLIFFSDQWNENIVEMKLVYTDTDGNSKVYPFTPETYNEFITISDVRMLPTDTVYMLRRGRVADCPDTINFDPLVISRKKSFTAGFVHAIERRYGFTTDTKEEEEKFEEFIENVNELEFDYDMDSFEDVLHCPKLKKIIFGKNRYLTTKSTPNDKSQFLGDLEKTFKALNKANEILGMTIERYGNNMPNSKHYFNDEPKYLTYMKYSSLPPLELVEEEAFYSYADGIWISCLPVDPYALLSNLQDDNSVSTWETSSSTSLREYELRMEFLEATEISGIKIAQPFYDPRSDQKTPNYMPHTITAQTSIDGVNWKNVTFLEFNDLGRGSGEVTLLPISDDNGKRKVIYIKLTLRDGVDMGGICSVKLGDILLYK